MRRGRGRRIRGALRDRHLTRGRRSSRILGDPRPRRSRRAHARRLIGAGDRALRRRVGACVVRGTRSRSLRRAGRRVLRAADAERLSRAIQRARGAVAIIIGYIRAFQRPGLVVSIHIQPPLGGGTGGHHRRHNRRRNQSNRGLHDRPSPSRGSARRDTLRAIHQHWIEQRVCHTLAPEKLTAYEEKGSGFQRLACRFRLTRCHRLSVGHSSPGHRGIAVVAFRFGV